MADNDQHALLLDIGARLTQMEKAFDRATGVVKRRSKEMENAGTSLERFFGKPSLGKAIDKTFDATRFKVLDSGAARVGIFGSALESLGPAGLTAAGAIGAVALALNQAHAAIEFADELDDAAKAAHTTTDALQELRYAVRLAGGEEKGADEALQSFSETLGKAQAGLKKSQKGFLELGFTKAQIDSFKDVDTALKAVTERITKLATNPQKDAVISQLGLEGLKPLILEGADAMDRLREAARQAGVVMDADMIRRGADAKETFVTMSQVINVQLKQAFIDLAPTLIWIMGLLAGMARLIGDLVNDFKSLDHKSVSGMQDEVAQIDRELRGFTDRVVHGPGEAAAVAKRIKLLEDRKTDLLGEIRRRDTSLDVPPPPSGTSLIDTSGGGGPHSTAHVKTEVEKSRDRDRLAAENQLAEAKARNDKAAVFGLEQQLDLQKRVEEYEKQGITDAVSRATADQGRLLLAQDIGQAAEDERATLDKSNEALKFAATKRQELLDLQKEEDRLAGEKLKKLASDNAEYFKDRTQKEFDATYNGIKGAFDALAQGHVWEYFLSRFEEAALSAFASSAAAAFLGRPDPNGGFSLGNILAETFGIPSKPGKNAGGTDAWRGGPTWVGERGPELVNLPRGAQVIPNDILRGLTAIRPAAARSAQGGMHFSYAPQIDARGMSPAELAIVLERDHRKFAQRALAQAPEFLTRHDRYRTN